jgi:hypothetical protein
MKLPEDGDLGPAQLHSALVRQPSPHELLDTEIRVLTGFHAGVTSPLPIEGLHTVDVRLLQDGVFEMPVPANHTSFVVPVSGDILIDGIYVGRRSLLAPVLERCPRATWSRVEGKKHVRFVSFCKPLQMIHHRDGWIAAYRRSLMLR